MISQMKLSTLLMDIEKIISLFKHGKNHMSSWILNLFGTNQILILYQIEIFLLKLKLKKKTFKIIIPYLSKIKLNHS